LAEVVNDLLSLSEPLFLLSFSSKCTKSVWWLIGSPQTHWRSYIPRVGVGRKWMRKEGRGRGLSGVSDRDGTITGWWGDK